MKTAIIKTGFWQDDEVFELNSDTRLLYLCLLTNPQRDLLPAFRCSDRMLSAYTGYSRDLIDICRRQLIDSGRIIYQEGYYIFTKQDYVKPSAGRDTIKIYEREYDKLPDSVKIIIESSTLVDSTGTSTGTSSGTSTGHNNNNINKDINNNINKDINNNKNNEIPKKYTDKDVELVKRLFATIADHFPNYKKLAERVPKDGDFEEMNKLQCLDGNDYKLIEDVLKWLFKGYKPMGEFDWKDQIKSVSNLRKHFDNLRRQYEKDKSSGKYRPVNYSSVPPDKRHKAPVFKPEEKHVHVSPEEAEKNRIILDLVRAKKVTFSDMKNLKSKSTSELREMLKPV